MCLSSADRRSQKAEEGASEWEVITDSYPGGLLVCDENLLVTQARGRAAEQAGGSWDRFIGQRADIVFHPLSNFGPGTNLWTRLRRDGRVEEKVFDSRVHQFFQLSARRIEPSTAGTYLLVLTEAGPQDMAARRADPSFRLLYLRQLIASLACELNNPLQSVVGYVDMLVKATSPLEASPQLELIQSESQRAAQLVKKLLLLTRFGPFELSQFPINQLVQEVLQSWRAIYRSKNISLEIECLAEEAFLRADRFQFQQLLQMLLSQAHQAVLAPSSNTSRSVKVRLSRDGNVLTLAISHNGPAIPNEQLPYIFDPFVTLEPGAGPGLGLAVCYTIVQGHNGRITCESTAENGTTFLVQLPLAATRTEQRAEFDFRSRKTPPRLLLIDDEPSIGAVFSQLLKMERIETDFITDANHAFPLLEQRHYDLILCDLNMPIMTGPEFYQRLALFRPDMIERIIFATGDLGAGQSELFQRNPALEVLYKPINSAKLLSTISDKISRITDRLYPSIRVRDAKVTSFGQARPRIRK